MKKDPGLFYTSVSVLYCRLLVREVRGYEKKMEGRGKNLQKNTAEEKRLKWRVFVGVCK